MKRENRSNRYQWVLLETVFSNEMLEAFSNDDSISARLNPFEYNENLLGLEDALKKRFWIIVETLLTDRQKEIMKLSADGYTQMEIAKKLNVNQSSIVKSLRGNSSYLPSYNDNKKVVIYGGAYKKLKALVAKDPEIIEILKKMDEIRELKW